MFTILLFAGEGKQILTFMNHSLSDQELPLEEPSAHDCFTAWHRSSIHNFKREQWKVLAPVFEPSNNRTVNHYELAETAIVPFTCWESISHSKFSIVYKARIHRAHHNLPQPEKNADFFAVKELLGQDRSSFDREKIVLESLRSETHRHDHLITLLATFSQNQTHYLIFPWAKHDLCSFWEFGKPHPSTDDDTALWLGQQCCGLAAGLYQIHHWKTTKISKLNPIHQSADEVELKNQTLVLYGRHGDIKPQNILWYPGGGHAGKGVLKLADFGAARFYTEESGQKSKVVSTTPNYRPPEYDTEAHDSKMASHLSWDVWALGCVYLEFITWFYGGWADVDAFAKARVASDPKWYDWRTSTFHVVQYDRNTEKSTAEIKKVVKLQIEKLRQSRPAYMFPEFISLIEKNMVIVEGAASRLTSRKVMEILSGFLPERLHQT